MVSAIARFLITVIADSLLQAGFGLRAVPFLSTSGESGTPWQLTSALQSPGATKAPIATQVLEEAELRERVDPPVTQTCEDIPSDWRSRGGSSCGQYDALEYCTSSGGMGSGWNAVGNQKDWASADGIVANEACCACGGGSQRSKSQVEAAQSNPDNTRYNKIVMTISTGCTGSSFIYWALLELIRRHHYQVWSPHKEFLVDKGDINNMTSMPYCTEADDTEHYWPYDPEDRMEAVWAVLSGQRKCKESIATKPTVFFFDGHEIELMMGAFKVLQNLPSENVKFLGLFREHRLEHLICAVKDCFRTNGSNYPVDKDGHRSKLCFGRRENGISDEDYKVHLDPDDLVESLEGLRPVWHKEPLQTVLDDITTRSFPGFPKATYEGLTAYEYSLSPMALETSVNMYKHVLSGIGVEPDTDIIKQYLAAQGMGTRLHHRVESEIYNLKEVEAALAGTAYEVQLNLGRIL